MDKETLGRFIADVRRNAGISQQQLAEQLHVTNTAVSKWERGLSYPDISLLEKLALSLGLSLTELIACQKAEDAGISTPSEDENMVSLLDIANDSQRTQRNRILRNTLIAAFAIIFLIGAIYFGGSFLRTYTSGAVYIGSQIKEKQNYVYMEIQGKFTPLLCEDPQIFNAIVACKCQ